MKNSILLKRLQIVKKENSIEIIEGSVLSTLKGGIMLEGCTKCKPNSCSPQNISN